MVPFLLFELGRALRSWADLRTQIYVNHTDGFTMQYGNPANTAQVNGQISLVRENYFAMQNISVDSYLPSVACPHNFIPGYDAEYTYY
jgi:mannan endo-1,4-beta-mannosidase